MTADERLANDPTSELWGEHRARYRFAAGLVADGRVLDVACGAGFGLRMLSQAGASAFGLDYDPSALAAARSIDQNARLIRADAGCLPLRDACLDVVVSFETIEHVADAEGLVAEIRRVLKPGGYLVLSTPNRSFGPPERHAGNPFHVREFIESELRDLLHTHFAEVQMYGQRPSPHFKYVPYLMVEPRYGPAALAWKAQTRLPFTIRNRLAFALSGRPFYPSEADYFFDAGSTDGAHALVVVAR